MEELKFTGIGSAFNTKLGNTSAYIKKNDSLILIDCGGAVFHKLKEKNVFEGIKNIYIFITHTHLDHVGSLGDVIFYAHYILGQKTKVFFPNNEQMVSFLINVGVTSDMYQLNSNSFAKLDDTEFGEVDIEFCQNTHVDTMPAYGFTMRIDKEVFYYSGDSNDINSVILDRFNSGEIQRIYQDTCGLDYKGNSHLSLKKLCEKIPGELRNRVYCMHLDEHISEEIIRDNGFNVAHIL